MEQLVEKDDAQVYVVNNYDYDLSQAHQFAGKDAEFPIVQLTVGAVRDRSANQIVEQMAAALRSFRPEKDYVLIAGRALANFLVGSVVSAMFPGQTIRFLTRDTRSETYRVAEVNMWDV